MVVALDVGCDLNVRVPRLGYCVSTINLPSMVQGFLAFHRSPSL